MRDASNMPESLRRQLAEALWSRLCSVPSLLIGLEGRLVFVSPAFEALVGQACGPFLGTRPPWPWWPPSPGGGPSPESRFLTADASPEAGPQEIACELVLADQKTRAVCLKHMPVRFDGLSPVYHAFEVSIPADGTALRPEWSSDRLPSEEIIGTLQRIAREIDELAAALGPVGERELAHGREPPGLATLSARERDVLSGLTEGKRPREIARELCISVHTAGNHIRAIYRKLAVHSQVELIRKLEPTSWRRRRTV